MMSRAGLSVRLALLLTMLGGVVLPDRVVAKSVETANREQIATESQFSPIDRAKISPTLLSQAAPTQITGVKLTPTDKGIDIVIETAAGTTLTIPTTSTQERATVAEIPNAVLALPDGKEFRAENPATGIANIIITQASPTTVRMSITGTEGVPTAQISTSDRGLAIAVTPVGSMAQTTEPELEINVVGLRNRRGYKLPNATTATKTDTPVIDVPQSIQIVPPEVLRDRKPRDLTQAVETVSGVLDGGNLYGSSASGRFIRGFRQDGNFRNGYRDASDSYFINSSIGNVDRVEVLKGPTSVLFGGGEPGGIVNVVTKQPLSTPYAKVEMEVGNRNFYQPSVDFSGPLNADKTLLYRFNGGYQSTNGFQDFVKTNQLSLAPSITWKIGDNTNLNLYYESNNFNGSPPPGYSALLSDGSLTPRNLFASYPELFNVNYGTQRFGYDVTHKFSEDWQIRNNLGGISSSNIENATIFPTAISNNQFLSLATYNIDYGRGNYFGQIDVLGKFKTGRTSHQLLIGFDFNSFNEYNNYLEGSLPVLDILNPNYNIAKPTYSPFLRTKGQANSYGIYLQDQIDLNDRFKLLIGGRYDIVSSKYEIDNFGTQGNTTDEPVRNTGAFSPRIGLVYQPSKNISLYTSYSGSFRAETGFSSATQEFKPSRGTQYEVGIKADFFDSKLSTTLAAYNLTKTNVATPDPTNPLFSIQTGEQRSQGIELDIAGEIAPGLKIIASYANTDARVTSDNATPIGNRLANVPRDQASLWTTYTIQTGDLRGLGFGLGLFYIGSRPGDLANSFELANYLRTDAAVYYRKDSFNAAINIRNLLDTDYASSAFGITQIQRGAPFTVVGSVGWEF
jgi:iron complex outermembrane recepter protein